ncbi:exo-alpha-sialidase, partial [candidate division WOR-3 bacterium]|nr:exo-alpha-sialidase [candidate division WOR-3 bacterium]
MPGRLCRAVMLVLLAACPLLAEWEPPVELAHNDTACYLALANCWALAASRDTLHAVWYDKRSGGFEVYYRRSSDGGTLWQPEARLTTDTVYSGYPAVAVSGRFVHVVWVQGIDARGDSWDQVMYRRSTDGGETWESALQLSHSSGGYYGGWFP